MAVANGQWQVIKDEARHILVDYAKQLRIVTHDKFREKLAASLKGKNGAASQIDNKLVKRLLVEIAQEEAQKRKGILPVVVVRNGSKRPKKSVVKAAESCKREIIHKDQFVLDERRRLYDELNHG